MGEAGMEVDGVGERRVGVYRDRMRPRTVIQAVAALLTALAFGLFCLHYLHLQADFPNHSPWVDWAKYTDEGWYGDGAIRHFESGRWDVPGDFNPAAALPVWPVVEAAVFRLTGVGIVPARALTVTIFGLTLVCVYGLLWGWSRRNRMGPLIPSAAVLLLAVSPFCYAFTRLAILEPLLLLLMLLALLTASAIDGVRAEVRRGERGSTQLWPLVLLGVLLPAMALTKTTAVFLFPAILWMVWARLGYSWGLLLRRLGLTAAIGATLWLMYFGLVVHLHLLADYRYLFDANAYTGVTWGNLGRVLRDTVVDGMWIGRVIFPLSLVAVTMALLRPRDLRGDPLTVSLLLWAGGYAAFLAYHNNLQPRYYLVLAVPLTMLVAMAPAVIGRLKTGGRAVGVLALAAGGLLVIVAGIDGRRMLGYVRSPQYSYVRAAEQIRRIIEADPHHSRLVLSISGSDLSLMTGLRSICDDFGTMELEERVATYHPGWYVSWNQVDDDKMEALTPTYQLERVAAFPAMDDPERNLLILYRLDPAMLPGRRRRRLRPPTPKVLRTRTGQQPSVTQLQH